MKSEIQRCYAVARPNADVIKLAGDIDPGSSGLSDLQSFATQSYIAIVSR